MKGPFEPALAAATIGAFRGCLGHGASVLLRPTPGVVSSNRGPQPRHGPFVLPDAHVVHWHRALVVEYHSGLQNHSTYSRAHWVSSSFRQLVQEAAACWPRLPTLACA